MRNIQTQKEYKFLCNRIKELSKIVYGNTPASDKNFIELNLLSDLINDYKKKGNEPVETPTLIEAIKLRMHERGLKQEHLAELLGISISTVSRYLTGKNKPTFKIAKDICQKLNIDPIVVVLDI